MYVLKKNFLHCMRKNYKLNIGFKVRSIVHTLFLDNTNIPIPMIVNARCEKLTSCLKKDQPTKWWPYLHKRQSTCRNKLQENIREITVKKLPCYCIYSQRFENERQQKIKILHTLIDKLAYQVYSKKVCSIRVKNRYLPRQWWWS
jgi:hypothetical protein